MDIREKMFAYFDGLADGMKIAEEDIDLPIKHESKPYLMIPFPDGATNGNMIKALFHVKDVKELECCTFVSIAGDADMRVYKDWWNAPYKAESEK